MDFDLTIKNYRCFPDSQPARLAVRDGFTALLGVNNSGKSSLLKFFYEFRPLFNLLASPRDSNASNLYRTRNVGVGLSGLTDPQEVFHNGNTRDLTISVSRAGGDTLEEEGSSVPYGLQLTFHREAGNISLQYPAAYESRLRGPPDNIGVSTSGLVTTVGRPCLHIGPFAALFRDLADTLYIGPFRNAVNVGAQNPYFDIAIGQAFVTTWKHLKTGASKQQSRATDRLTKEIREIFGFEQLEINPSSDDQTLQLFLDGESYRLNELGSGMAQFIVVLANAATRRPAFVLIDEPELNLHPSLQLVFLTTLGSYARRGTFFATHSYGLARAGAEWIYTLRKGRDNGSEMRVLEATDRLSELLGELSYSGYREVGYEKVLLVEGATDVKTIRQFLRHYDVGHKVLTLQLGGSGLINGGRSVELEEVTRISPHVHALIDSERPGPGESLAPCRQEFVESCENLGIRCHVLERRATENYFTDAAVQAAIGRKFSALGPYEKLESRSPHWSKNANWRIAREMTRSDFDGTDLGRFLASL